LIETIDPWSVFHGSMAWTKHTISSFAARTGFGVGDGGRAEHPRAGEHGDADLGASAKTVVGLSIAITIEPPSPLYPGHRSEVDQVPEGYVVAVIPNRRSNPYARAGHVSDMPSEPPVLERSQL
jgi:hypothetical protein